MGIGGKWSQIPDLNWRPAGYKTAALPTELIWPAWFIVIFLKWNVELRSKQLKPPSFDAASFL